MTTNSNSLAFPLHAQEFLETGLTKREYFAAIALQGYLAAFAGAGADVAMPTDQNAAESAVNYADALIHELNKEQRSP